MAHLAWARVWPKTVLDPVDVGGRYGIQARGHRRPARRDDGRQGGRAKVGQVEDVFLDRQSARPGWAAVRTGLFGRRHTIVPIADAFLNPNGEVQVPFAKDQIKEAPNIEPGQELTPELEREMWAYYGMSGYEAWRRDDQTHGLGLPDDAEDTAAQDGAPVMVRPRRVVLVAVVPVGDND